MVEQMMRDRLASQQPTATNIEVRRVGDPATVNNYPCIRYEVHQDGRKVRDLWVTEWSNLEGGREIAPLFEQLGLFFDEMQAILPGNQDAIEDNMFTSMSQLNGFPIASRDYRPDGTTDTEAVLRTSGRQNLDPAMFEPPAEYRRQQMLPGQQ